jgi:hypothetical protein
VRSSSRSTPCSTLPPPQTSQTPPASPPPRRAGSPRSQPSRASWRPAAACMPPSQRCPRPRPAPSRRRSRRTRGTTCQTTTTPQTTRCQVRRRAGRAALRAAQCTTSRAVAACRARWRSSPPPPRASWAAPAAGTQLHAASQTPRAARPCSAPQPPPHAQPQPPPHTLQARSSCTTFWRARASMTSAPPSHPPSPVTQTTASTPSRCVAAAAGVAGWSGWRLSGWAGLGGGWRMADGGWQVRVVWRLTRQQLHVWVRSRLACCQQAPAAADGSRQQPAATNSTLRHISFPLPPTHADPLLVPAHRLLPQLHVSCRVRRDHPNGQRQAVPVGWVRCQVWPGVRLGAGQRRLLQRCRRAACARTGARAACLPGAASTGSTLHPLQRRRPAPLQAPRCASHERGAPQPHHPRRTPASPVQ